jgi:hypothetical protein
MSGEIVAQKKPQIKDITGENIVQISRKIIALMSKHIGKDNGVSKRNLFKHFFGIPENYNTYQQMYLWSKLLTVMGYVRRNTKCFIVSEHRATDYYFFVARYQTDANVYIKGADERIIGLNNMKKRAQKAIDEKWYAVVEQVGARYALADDKTEVKQIKDAINEEKK